MSDEKKQVKCGACKGTGLAPDDIINDANVIGRIVKDAESGKQEQHWSFELDRLLECFPDEMTDPLIPAKAKYIIDRAIVCIKACEGIAADVLEYGIEPKKHLCDVCRKPAGGPGTGIRYFRETKFTKILVHDECHAAFKKRNLIVRDGKIRDESEEDTSV